MFRVLIVDDEQLMREALSIMVSKVAGFEVADSVNSGVKAIEICSKDKIDIVFMDIIMPGMSGIEASKNIYINNPNTTIYIISAYNNFEFAREALKAEVKEYISKPVSCTTIKRLLSGYMDSHSRYQKYAEILISIIKQKDYKKMYYEIPKIVNEICLSIGIDTKLRKKTFMQIGQYIIDYNRCPDESIKKCEDLFPLSEVLLSEKKSLEFWLFNLVDYIFQQSAVKKYKVLNSIFEYINKNIKKKLGLSEIVENCSISQGYLSRIFMKQMNVSVIEYIHMKKLILAKSYFTYTDFSILDVALRLGYNESSYFCKVFKKYEHQTVLQYKKTLEQYNNNLK